MGCEAETGSHDIGDEERAVAAESQPRTNLMGHAVSVPLSTKTATSVDDEDHLMDAIAELTRLSAFRSDKTDIVLQQEAFSREMPWSGGR